MRQAMHSLFTRVAGLVRRKDGRRSWRWPPPAETSLQAPIAVIGLVPSEADRQLLSGLCRRSGWNLLFVDTCEDARIALHKLKAPVVLFDRDLPGGDWRGVVRDLASSPHRACVILVSAVVDAYLWNEVVRTGGFEVLSKPLREEEVIRAVRLASSYWNSSTGKAVIPGQPEFPEIR